MRGLVLICFVSLLTISGLSQVRNGWRSIYDKEGRLSRMNYYENGKLVPDSNLFYQYYTDNIPKVIVKGLIDSKIGCVNGTVSLFDPRGMVESYHIKREGEMVFDTNCDYDGNCTSIWNESFDVNSGAWLCDSVSITHGEMIIHNKQSIGVAIFEPEIPIDLNQDFSCKLSIPVEGNTANQGLALGWKDENNFILFELLFGKYYSIQKWVNGERIEITDGRQTIEQTGNNFNDLAIYKKNKNLIVEINGSIHNVLPVPDFLGDKIALVTRSRGNARFSNFVLQYTLPPGDMFFDQHWVGKGTGFFISGDGKILATYESVYDAKRIRVKGSLGGKQFVLPVKIIRVEEENNLVVLKIDSAEFKAFNEVPFGFYNHAPVTDSKVFCIGYPNAVSGVYTDPDVFEGVVLSGLASSSGNRMLQLDFRNGMIGAPIFDWDFNFLGIYSSKGLELKYSEMIDFYNNSRLFKANFGNMASRVVSPHQGKNYQEKYAVGAELVVLIETSMFGDEDAEFEGY